MGSTEPARPYVMKRVQIDPRTGCWNWTMAIRSNGYGWCSRRDWRGSAHRFAYTHFVGEIPEGLQLDHLCRNRGCVNPDHLEPVTAQENISRAHSLRERAFSVYQASTGLWTAALSSGSGADRRRKVFRSNEKSEVIRRMTAWIAESR